MKDILESEYLEVETRQPAPDYDRLLKWLAGFVMLMFASYIIGSMADYAIGQFVRWWVQ